MAQELFRRHCRVQIGRLVVENLRTTFEVHRQLKAGEPNTAEIRITNLNKDHRDQLQEQKSAIVKLEAGYKAPELGADTNAALSGIGLDAAESTLPQLFLGELSKLYSYREGPDWVTVLATQDGKKGSKKRVSAAFKPSVRWMEVFQKLIKSTELDVGNSFQALSGTLSLQNTEGPLTLYGPALGELERLARGFGYEVSVQDGALQVLERGKALQSGAVVLTPSTGLLGSPEPGSDGLVRFRTLLLPDLYPGRAVELDARHASGRHRLEQCTYLGDTRGGPWYVDCEAKPV